MKHFFIARHGAYYINGHLNKLGEKQIMALSQAIKKIIDGSSVCIISSTAPRALDSSEILARELESEGQIEEIPCLWYAADSGHYDPIRDLDLGEIYNIVNERKGNAEALILMAHEELRDAFAAYYSERELGMRLSFDPIGKGQADYFCLVDKNYQLIPKTE